VKQESNMRRLILTSFVLTVALTVFFLVPSAQSMTVPVPIGLRAVVDKLGPAEKIAFVCSLVRRCGPYGCEKRQCWETGYGFGPAYGPGYGFGYVYSYSPAEGFAYGPGYGPGYGFGYGPGPDYGGGYHVGRRISNGCPPHWFQDGGCRPYRGY
jgi:hypothetical protein